MLQHRYRHVTYLHPPRKPRARLAIAYLIPCLVSISTVSPQCIGDMSKGQLIGARCHNAVKDHAELHDTSWTQSPNSQNLNWESYNILQPKHLALNHRSHPRRCTLLTTQQVRFRPSRARPAVHTDTGGPCWNLGRNELHDFQHLMCRHPIQPAWPTWTRYVNMPGLTIGNRRALRKVSSTETLHAALIALGKTGFCSWSTGGEEVR